MERRLIEYLKDRYEVVQHLARTEHSEVFLVKHKALEVLRVAKVVSRESADYERALKEANIIKNYKHPGIPLVYDIEVSGDSICIIEEYIAGKSLAEVIYNERILPVQAASLGASICEVLEFLHNCVGIVHMDLKPENIIVRNQSVYSQGFLKRKQRFNYEVCIIDFDSSGYRGQSQKESYGTVGFAAPEQYSQGEQRPSVEMDIYSCGVLLLYMLCGGHIQSIADSADKLCQLHSETIGPIITRCLRHSRNQRFKSITELKEALLVVAQGYNSKSKSNNTCEVRNIYVYGREHCVGTTHFSLCLAAFLGRRYKGAKVLYKRVGDPYDIRAEAQKGLLTRNGVYKRHGIYIMPDYRGGINCNESEYDYIVQDYGIVRPDDLLVERDSGLRICVSVCGYGKDRLLGKDSEGDITFVNHISGRQFYELVKSVENVKPLYRIPCIYQWNETNRLLEEAVIEALELGTDSKKKKESSNN